LIKFFLIFHLFFFLEVLAISAKANKFAHDHLLEGEFKLVVWVKSSKKLREHHGIGDAARQADMAGSSLRVVATTTRGIVAHNNQTSATLGDLQLVAVEEPPICPEVTGAGRFATGKGTDNSIISHH
jgi:hypothetical protein